MRNHGAEGVGGAAEVHVDDVLPVLVRHFRERAIDLNRSVRDRDIELAKFFCGAISRGFHRWHVADVRFDADPAALLCFDQLASLIQVFSGRRRINQIGRGDSADIDAHHVGASRGEGNADCLTNSTRGSGHKRGFALETEIQVRRFVADICFGCCFPGSDH